MIKQSDDKKNNIAKQIHTDLLNEDKTHKIKDFFTLQHDKIESSTQQFINNICDKWNNLVRQQSKLPMWILVTICLSSSVLLWCKFLIY